MGGVDFAGIYMLCSFKDGPHMIKHGSVGRHGYIIEDHWMVWSAVFQ